MIIQLYLISILALPILSKPEYQGEFLRTESESNYSMAIKSAATCMASLYVKIPIAIIDKKYVVKGCVKAKDLYQAIAVEQNLPRDFYEVQKVLLEMERDVFSFKNPKAIKILELEKLIVEIENLKKCKIPEELLKIGEKPEYIFMDELPEGITKYQLVNELIEREFIVGEMKSCRIDGLIVSLSKEKFEKVYTIPRKGPVPSKLFFDY